MTNLKLGSLFDGSGGFPLGGLMAGITPVWASEVEPFPIRVTTKRIPFMKHYGDVSKMHGGEIEPVDIITFGSPCQDMSVAGKRAGLDGSRSNLFYEAIRIVKEMRCATNGQKPRYIVWENVPGAFSSNKGQDFRSVLEAVCGAALCTVKDTDPIIPEPPKGRWESAGSILGDSYSVAWRTLDAQFWGVPQRRKRIYLIADFAGGSAGKILFESEGLSGYSSQSFRAWQRTAAGSENSPGTTGISLDGYNGSVSDKATTLGVNCGMSTGRNGVVLNDQGGSRMDVTEEVTCTLRAEAHHPPCVLDTVPLENHPTDSRIKISEDGNVQTLTSRMGTGGNNVPLIMNMPTNWDGGQISPTLTKQNAGGNQRMPDKDNFNCVLQPYGICSKNSNSMQSDNPHSGIYEADTARTLDGNGGNPSCNQGGIALVESYTLQGSMIGRKDENGPKGDGINKDISFTLNATDRHAVYAMTTGSFPNVAEGKAPPVLARDYKDATVVTEPSFGIGRDAFNQGRNALYAPSFEEELQPTLVAKGPGAVQNGYTVRRLTPTECAKLQGFPDWWGVDLGTVNPSESDIGFWTEVFETHRIIMGTSTKPKTRAQIIRWLKAPYSDSAEYKMWGNGVALPCVFFVLAGIVYYTQIDGCL